jgi:hypothetical protein
LRFQGTRLYPLKLYRGAEKLLRPDENVDVKENCKISKSLEKPPLSEAGKHPDFQG